MAKQIKLVRSLIGCKKNQIETAHSLGLKKIGEVVTQPDNAQTMGKIKTISHLVEVKEV
ncbi:MAG: 50S ribosomal protein L30 [Ruminococcus sp.]|jgi:large subunit ribosomal protein L30|nr:50S ribosomal protein L30 [Ruminococcus sp.]MBP1564407.1 50S ribosomal protein L30 [Oscillospiraceae bacterium]